MICLGLGLLGMLIGLASCGHTIWFVRKSRGYREESRAQLQRTLNQVVGLAEENSLLRHQLLELQRLRGNDQEPT